MVDIKELFNISNTGPVVLSNGTNTKFGKSLKRRWSMVIPLKINHQQVPISTIVGWISTAPIPTTKKRSASRRQMFGVNCNSWDIDHMMSKVQGSPTKHSTKSLEPQGLVQEREWGSSFIRRQFFVTLFPDGSESPKLRGYRGVSKNRDTPKWMVYNGIPYKYGWFGGTTISGNYHRNIGFYLPIHNVCS